MYLIPGRERVQSLVCASQKTLFRLVTESKCKNEDDIETARSYLKVLPLTLRLQLAKDIEKHLRDPYYTINPKQVYVRAQEKFALWRVGCFLPEARDVPVTLLHVAFDNHYSAKALQYLSCEEEECEYNNASLIFKAGFPDNPVRKDPLPSLSFRAKFKILVSRFTNLTDVTLGTQCGDSSLVVVGERCKKLKKLTLSDRGFTNDAFVKFAKSQQRNDCLDELVLLCSRLQITFRALTQIWVLPLAIKTLACHCTQFDCGTDDIQLECPNGPTKLTNLTVKWDMMTDIQRSRVEKVLNCTDVLFPALQRMKWIDPSHEMVTSGKVWGTVESLNQRSDSEINLEKLANCFPKIVSLKLRNMANVDSLHCGLHFKYLKKFAFHGRSGGVLSFKDFSSILTVAKSLHIIIVEVLPEVIEGYSDSCLIALFRQCKHLNCLEVFRLYRDRYSEPDPKKIPLSESSVLHILQACKNMKLLGDLDCWAVNLAALGNIVTDKKYECVGREEYFDIVGYEAARKYFN